MNFWCSLWACGLGLVWFGREWLFPEDGFLRQRTGNGLGLGPWLGPSLSAPAPKPGCQALGQTQGLLSSEVEGQHGVDIGRKDCWLSPHPSPQGDI